MFKIRHWIYSALGHLDGGFTLIEMMVTVLIAAILASVAIPEYLRYIEKSRNVEAMENITKIVLGAKTYWTHHEKMPDAGGGAEDESLGDLTYKGQCLSSKITVQKICSDHIGIYDRTDVNTTMNEKGSVCDMLLWQPEGEIRFRYVYSGGSTGTQAVGVISAERLMNCAPNQLIRFRMILSTDDEGGLGAVGPLMDEY